MTFIDVLLLIKLLLHNIFLFFFKKFPSSFRFASKIFQNIFQYFYFLFKVLPLLRSQLNSIYTVTLFILNGSTCRMASDHSKQIVRGIEISNIFWNWVLANFGESGSRLEVRPQGDFQTS